MVKYTSRIVYSMAREGNMPLMFSRVAALQDSDAMR